MSARKRWRKGGISNLKVDKGFKVRSPGISKRKGKNVWGGGGEWRGFSGWNPRGEALIRNKPIG